jgi:transcriptional regulator with AAA-type ATPase domain
MKPIQAFVARAQDPLLGLVVAALRQKELSDGVRPVKFFDIENLDQGALQEPNSVAFVSCTQAAARAARSKLGRTPIIAVAGPGVADDDLGVVSPEGADDYVLAGDGQDGLLDVGPRTSPARLLAIMRQLLELPAPWPLVGCSHEMQKLRDMTEKVACQPSPNVCLILGERGSGKELIAKAIHEYRKLAFPNVGELIAVNCPSVPDDLFARELFGSLKGAFSGADRDRQGLVKAAEQGVLFLDEIGDLKLENQIKLLRFLEGMKYRPVGASDKERTADVFVIAATNRDIGDPARFRPDMFDRLNAFTIRTLPLRDLRSDIPLLARHLTKTVQAVSANKQPVLTISPSAQRRLLEWDYPSNVRGLRNAIKRAKLNANGHMLLARDIVYEEIDHRTPAATEDPRDDAGEHLAADRPGRSMDRGARGTSNVNKKALVGALSTVTSYPAAEATTGELPAIAHGETSAVTPATTDDLREDDNKRLVAESSQRPQPRGRYNTPRIDKKTLVDALKAISSRPVTGDTPRKRRAILATLKGKLQLESFQALCRELARHGRTDESLLEEVPKWVRDVIIEGDERLASLEGRPAKQREIQLVTPTREIAKPDPQPVESRCYFALGDPFCQKEIADDYRRRGYPQAEIAKRVEHEVRYGLKAAALLHERVIVRATAALTSDVTARVLWEAQPLLEQGVIVPEFRSDEADLRRQIADLPGVARSELRASDNLYSTMELLDGARRAGIELPGTKLSLDRSRLLMQHLFRQKALEDRLPEPYLRREVEWEDLDQIFDLLSSRRPVNRAEFVDRLKTMYVIPSRAFLLVQLIYFGVGAGFAKANPYLPKLMDPAVRLWAYPELRPDDLPAAVRALADKYDVLRPAEQAPSASITAGVRPDQLADVLLLSELIIADLSFREIAALREHNVGLMTRRTIAELQRESEGSAACAEQCRRKLYEAMLAERRLFAGRERRLKSATRISADSRLLQLAGETVCIGSVAAGLDAETSPPSSGRGCVTPLLVFSQLVHHTRASAGE